MIALLIFAILMIIAGVIIICLCKDCYHFLDYLGCMGGAACVIAGLMLTITSIMTLL